MYDAGGNNNGRLDPGETVNLTAFLKNVGGQPFTSLTSVLSTTSPYITITDNAGVFGPLLIDSTKENAADPYAISAAAGTPNGHRAPLRLVVTETGFCDTFDFNVTVGTFHYLVWNNDPTPGSGQIIDSLLRDLNYNGLITTTLPTRGVLDLYRAVLVCVGIYPNNRIITAGSAEATALAEYVNGGGRMYLEGGDVFYYDPLYQGGYNFNTLFGINPTSDGAGDLGPIDGQAGTFTNTMSFAYAGENNYMDQISPTGSGSFLIFRDTDGLYDCGVARDAGTFRTVGCSFELGYLTDASGVSTRRALVDSIMKFFGISLVASEETGGQDLVPLVLKATPNPFRTKTDIQFSIGRSASGIALNIFDCSGRLVKSFSLPSALCPVPSALSWQGQDEQGRPVPAGIYFVRLEADTRHQVEKIVLVR